MATLKQKHNEVRRAFYEFEAYLFGDDRVKAETGFYNESIKRYQTLGLLIERIFEGNERDAIMKHYLKGGLYLTESAGKVQGYLDSFRVKLNQTTWLREISARERNSHLSASLSGAEKIKASDLIERQADLWDSFLKANRSLKMRIKGGSKKLVDIVEVTPSDIGTGFLHLHLAFETAGKTHIKDYLTGLKNVLKKNILNNPI